MIDNNYYILRKYVNYTVFDIENIANKQISLTSPRNFNDPLDSYFFYSNEKYLNDIKAILKNDIINQIFITCFTDFKNIRNNKNQIKLTPNEILMWTHYGNAHKGLCLEFKVPKNDQYLGFIDINSSFDFERTYLANVKYIEHLANSYADILTPEQNQQFDQALQNVFFTKDNAFKYENEVRLLVYSKTDENYITYPFAFLNKIIFGCRCNQNTKNLIKNINKNTYDNKLELYEINNIYEEIKING